VETVMTQYILTIIQNNPGFYLTLLIFLKQL